MRTPDYVTKGETEGKSLVDAMRDGSDDGMQEFDGALEQLVEQGVITWQTALTYATNQTNLRLRLSDVARGEQDNGDSIIELASDGEKVEV